HRQDNPDTDVDPRLPLVGPQRPRPPVGVSRGLARLRLQVVRHALCPALGNGPLPEPSPSMPSGADELADRLSPREGVGSASSRSAVTWLAVLMAWQRT